MKKLISCILLLSIILSSFTLPSFAVTEETTPEDYLIFVPKTGLERIDAHGDFTFQFRSAINSSDYFRPTRTSITISCITDGDTNSWFYVYLILNGETVGSLFAKDSGKEYSKTFHDLDTSEYYNIALRKVNIGSAVTITGTGHITNIEVL